MKEYIIYFVVEAGGILISMSPKLETGIRIYTFVLVTIINLLAIIISLLIKNRKLIKDVGNLEQIKKDLSLQIEEQHKKIDIYNTLLSCIESKIDIDNKRYLKSIFSEITEVYNKFKIKRRLDNE